MREFKYVRSCFSRRGGNEIIKVDDDKSADIHLIMQESSVRNNDPGWLLVVVWSSIVFANRTNQEKGGHFFLRTDYRPE
jgi:formate-dependent nitrite reductase cytochrome c552 subunit